MAHNFALKQAIGKAAAEQIHSGDTLLINDGSTTFHLAAHLKGKGPLVIYTNSLAMISELSQSPDILESCQVDVAVIGADAIDAQGRCLVYSPEEARLTQAMLRCGRRRILLADHTKYKAAGTFAYGTLKNFNLWITTKGLRAETLRKLQKLAKIIQVPA